MLEYKHLKHGPAQYRWNCGAREDEECLLWSLASLVFTLPFHLPAVRSQNTECSLCASISLLENEDIYI